MFCVHCGFQNEDGYRFCVSCGKPLEAGASEVVGSVVGAAPAAASAAGVDAFGTADAFGAAPAMGAGAAASPAAGMAVFGNPGPNGGVSPSVTAPAMAAVPLAAASVSLIRKSSGKTYEISQFPATIGKGSAATVRIDGNNTVSRAHVRIVNAGGMFSVEELGATNSTYLNGRRLAPRETAPLSNGDELQLSDEKFLVSMR